MEINFTSADLKFFMAISSKRATFLGFITFALFAMIYFFGDNVQVISGIRIKFYIICLGFYLFPLFSYLWLLLDLLVKKKIVHRKMCKFVSRGSGEDYTPELEIQDVGRIDLSGDNVWAEKLLSEEYRLFDIEYSKFSQVILSFRKL